MWPGARWARASGRAEGVFDVTFNTTALSPGTYTLQLQLIDGRSIGDANNTVFISQFSLGRGGALGEVSAANAGGVSGDLATGVTLTDSAFLNLFGQSFSPGDALRFRVETTMNPDPGIPDPGSPDAFAIAILDSAGTPLPTTDPNGGVAFLAVDVPSQTTPAYQSYASTDPTLDRLRPTAEPSAVPLPLGVWGGVALFGLAGVMRRRVRG